MWGGDGISHPEISALPKSANFGTAPTIFRIDPRGALRLENTAPHRQCRFRRNPSAGTDLGWSTSCGRIPKLRAKNQTGTDMARSDLLVSLVKAGASGDRKSLSSTVEAIIAEERAKQHNVLADRLTRVLRNSTNGSYAGRQGSEFAIRVRDYVSEVTPRKRLDDLFLPETCRRACDELIEEQQRASLLRSQSLEPRHQVLVVGPPGNGKTSLAEGIAEALAVQFFIVRYDAVIGSFLGETATRLRRVFDYARTTPCVLFFDEFDAVGKERGDVNETGEIKRVVTSLLMQVDDLPS